MEVHELSNILIASGVSGLVFYYWGWHAARKKTVKQLKQAIKLVRKEYVPCVDERHGSVTYIRRDK